MNKKRLVFILGNLTAFGPFITDFYLPCLPELTAYFGGSASLIQLSLTAGMLGLAAGQLLVGPVTDKYGRRARCCGACCFSYWPRRAACYPPGFRPLSSSGCCRD